MVLSKKSNKGFTIVELLVVIVVIAILAAVTVVAYNGLTARVKETSLKTDLESAAKQLQVLKIQSGTDTFPANAASLIKSDSTVFQYTSTGATYCLSATNNSAPGITFYITESGSIVQGGCLVAAIANGAYMQTITNSNCPSARTRAVDARDNRTYWVQKMADGKCWMLTNLAYGGDGDNAYGDVKSLTNVNTGSYTLPRYYIPASGANVTVEPANPSESVNGGSTNPQYGYLYNWCAANGGQATNGCSQTNLPALNRTISICPAGWKLPTGNGGEYGALNDAINGGSSTTNAGFLSAWFMQYSGFALGSGIFAAQGTVADLWTSSYGSNNNQAYATRMQTTLVNTAYAVDKTSASAVRCTAV